MTRQLTPEQLIALRATPVSDDAPNRVRVAIALANVRRGDLADALGISPTHITNVIKGDVPNLPLPTARRFAECFGCEVDDLFPSRERVA